MLALLMLACDDGDPLAVARKRADAFLDAHPVGSAVVQVGLDRAELDGVVGTRWHGTDLATWLAPCELPSGTRFQAELRLEPGAFPWTHLGDDEDLPPCAKDRLATFPFEEPSRRGDADLVVVRWRPEEEAPPATVREEDGGAVLAELAPPYWRRAEDRGALVPGLDLRVDGGRVRIRPTGVPIRSGALEDAAAWARRLTCTADRLDLVRTTLVFDGGYLEEITTEPETECVQERALEARDWLSEQRVGGEPLAKAGRTLVVLDVPVGAW